MTGLDNAKLETLVTRIFPMNVTNLYLYGRHGKDYRVLFSKVANDNEIKNSSYQPSSVYGNGHSLYYANVIDTLRGKSEPETDGQDGLKTLELIIAAYESSVTGKVISLPLSKQYEL